MPGRNVVFVIAVACGGSRRPDPPPPPPPVPAPTPQVTSVDVPPQAKLRFTELVPKKGDSDGGTYVVLKGERFIKDGPRHVKVYFGSKQGSVVRFQSDSELVVQAPRGKVNETVDVLVIFDPGGQLVLKSAFTYIDKNDTGPNVDDLNK